MSSRPPMPPWPQVLGRMKTTINRAAKMARNFFWFRRKKWFTGWVSGFGVQGSGKKTSWITKGSGAGGLAQAVGRLGGAGGRVGAFELVGDLLVQQQRFLARVQLFLD